MEALLIVVFSFFINILTSELKRVQEKLELSRVEIGYNFNISNRVEFDRATDEHEELIYKKTRIETTISFCILLLAYLVGSIASSLIFTL